MVNWFGIIGLVLLAIGWLPETIDVIIKKKAKLNLKFASLYTVGSIFLAIYAYQLGDMIFIILNTAVAIMSGTSLIYCVKK